MNTDLRTIKELRIAIRKATTVYASTGMTVDDMTYVRVVKSDILETLKNFEDFVEVNAMVDENNEVWIA